MAQYYKASKKSVVLGKSDVSADDEAFLSTSPTPKPHNPWNSFKDTLFYFFSWREDKMDKERLRSAAPTKEHDLLEPLIKKRN